MARRCSTTPWRSSPRPTARGLLAADATAKDFVTDAHAHCKFIAYTPDAAALLDAAGVTADIDDGYTVLAKGTAAADFIESCRNVRFWARARAVDQT